MIKTQGTVNQMQATAIIMAGGKRKRMGKDKSILPINGMPAIKHVFAQLQPHFNQIIVSSNNFADHSFPGVKVVKDEATGKGPLMGIASALRVSRNQVNFIIACDITEVDINLARQMVGEIKDFDAIIPQTGPTHFEPLFAVYKKSMLRLIDESISSGNYKIMELVKKCSVKYIELFNAGQFRNLNTMKDYLQFIEDKGGITIR